MEKKVKSIEVRTGDGKLIFSLFLIEKEVDLEKKPEAPAAGKSEAKPETRKGNGQGNNSGSDEPMTEAQRRYLFRILADQGIEGDAAYAHVKKTFGVTNLKEIGKQEASQTISRLLEEAKGVHDGPPF